VSVTEAISLGLLRSPALAALTLSSLRSVVWRAFVIRRPYVGLSRRVKSTRGRFPGDWFGEAYDKEGRRGFVLTLATREQQIAARSHFEYSHQRRLDRVGLDDLFGNDGRRGLQEVAEQCAQKTAYAAQKIGALSGYSIPFTGPRFNEFVVTAPVAARGCLRVWRRRKT